MSTIGAGDRPLHFRPAAVTDDEQVARQVRMLDAQAELPAVRRLRAWAVEALRVARGEVAVDVGSGTGEQVQALADLVGPTGRAVGVEPGAGLREHARGRAAAAGRGPDFVDGVAERLPFEDASVDAVHCERVLQHLSDPAAAVAEMARVLRPGGRVVLVDSDWSTALVHPAAPDVQRRVLDGLLAAAPNPLSGRRLPGLLTAAGLAVDPDVGSAALALVGPALARSPIVDATVSSALHAGTLGPVEAAGFAAEFRAAAQSGEAMLSVTMYAVLARRR